MHDSGSGALPRAPRFFALVSVEAVKEAVLPYCLPQTRHGAHVAPQRCTILCVGKAVQIYHIWVWISIPPNQIVLDLGYTSKGQSPAGGRSPEEGKARHGTRFSAGKSSVLYLRFGCRRKGQACQLFIRESWQALALPAGRRAGSFQQNRLMDFC